MIPRVAASESGGAQTVRVETPGRGCRAGAASLGGRQRNPLESGAVERDSRVCEAVRPGRAGT